MFSFPFNYFFLFFQIFWFLNVKKFMRLFFFSCRDENGAQSICLQVAIFHLHNVGFLLSLSYTVWTVQREKGPKIKILRQIPFVGADFLSNTARVRASSCLWNFGFFRYFHYQNPSIPSIWKICWKTNKNEVNGKRWGRPRERGSKKPLFNKLSSV